MVLRLYARGTTCMLHNFGGNEAFDLVAEDRDQDGRDFSAVVDLAPYSVLIYSWQG